MLDQAKLRSYRHIPIYMFGVLVPKDHDQAMDIDKQNGNTKWRGAEETELKSVDEYDTFQDCGHKSRAPPPRDYKKIKVRMVFAVKHDGRHKARLAARGDLTDVPIHSAYSGVVSLKGLGLIVFISESNDLELWAIDIGNSHLEASTTAEKVHIIGGPEFGAR